MSSRYCRKLRLAVAPGIVALTVLGCGPRVLVSTGTTIGLKATPGDGYTRPPQVTLGYKRAESALVPTAGENGTARKDAFSTLAAIYFRTTWFRETELRSFIGTGIAAQEILKPPGSEEAAGAAIKSNADTQTESAFTRALLGNESRTEREGPETTALGPKTRTGSTFTRELTGRGPGGTEHLKAPKR